VSPQYSDLVEQFEKHLLPSLDAEMILLDKARDLLYNMDKTYSYSNAERAEHAIYCLRGVLLLNRENVSARELLYFFYKNIWEISYPDEELIGMAYLSIENNLLLCFNSYHLIHKVNKYDILKIVGKDQFDLEADLLLNENQERLNVTASVLHLPEDRVFFYQRPMANFLSLLIDTDKYKIKFEGEKGQELDSTFISIENINNVEFAYQEKMA
jgi:hypothetical protein